MLSLSRQFVGHEQDIKSVATKAKSIYSCSRDGTVREWTIGSDSTTEKQQYRSHRGFINAIAYHEGYIISGGQDACINITKEGVTQPEYTLVGHTGNVCALDVSDTGLIASGSWDGTAKVWKDGKCLYTMEGHEGAVWAVLWTPHGILTGGADRTIRLWKDGVQIKNFEAGKDCVRALSLHPLGFASAGNDAVIRIHTFEGDVVHQLEGHESFIYALAVAPDERIFSTGEDRTLRVWQNGSLAQTIVHPAVSVWCLAIMENGDVITGASDSVVRVFTSEKDRTASTDLLNEFEQSVANSTIPAQSTSIPNNLPGIEALAGPGAKEGEVKMIRTSPEVVEAHQWSGGVWTKIGEVVGATSKKVEYEGKEWDFVFDVDIAEGVPPLKLPYNTDENPYEAANRFIAKYELDVGFQGQIVKFIETNTGGIPLGVPKTQPPSGSEPKAQSTTLVPQREFLSMLAGNPDPILRKLQSLVTDEQKFSGIQNLVTTSPSASAIQTLVELLGDIPRESRFPVLDLLRLSVVKVPANSVNLEDLLTAVLQVSEFQADTQDDKTRETNIMLSLRCLTNLYATPGGIEVLSPRAEGIQEQISGIHYPANRNLSLAQATYLLNASVLAHRESSTTQAINLLECLLRLIGSTKDSETAFRSLIAFGTLLHISEDVIEASRDVFDAATTLRAVDEIQDQRIKEVLCEIRSLLK